MTKILDINDNGPSAQLITVRSAPMQLLLNGTWSGATVTLEKLLDDGSWNAVREWTDNAYPIIETVGTGKYRMNTSGTPSIVCDVTFIEGTGSVK